MKLTTIHRKASALLENGKVRACIDEIQARLRDKFEITIESLPRDFMEDPDAAREVGQHAVAVKATQEITRLNGKYETDNRQKQQTLIMQLNINREPR